MKIALCLSGLLGGLNGRNGIGKKIDPRNAFYWYNKNIIAENNVDVFFHTWDDEGYDLVKLYNPKKHMIENQIDFSQINYKFYKSKSYHDLYLKEERLSKKYIFKTNEIKSLKESIYRSNSKWYSVYKAIKQKKEFEITHKFKYDYVIISRFDIALTKKIEFNKLQKNRLYLSSRSKNQLNVDRSFNDLIFLGDSNQTDLFAEIYNNLNKYSVDPTYSAYEHIIKNNINWEHHFDYNKDTFILRWNQHLMRFSPQPYYYIKHNLREIKRKILNA